MAGTRFIKESMSKDERRAKRKMFRCFGLSPRLAERLMDWSYPHIE